MKAFKYVGPIDEVDLLMADGTHVLVAIGDTVEVDDELAAGFDSGAWEAEKVTKTKGAKDDG